MLCLIEITLQEPLINRIVEVKGAALCFQRRSQATQSTCHSCAPYLGKHCQACKNNILNFTVSDLDNAPMVGIKSVKLFGTDIVIFIDLIVFLTDYPTVSSVLGVISHLGERGCPLCPLKEMDILKWAYGYSTMITTRWTSNILFAQKSWKI